MPLLVCQLAYDGARYLGWQDNGQSPSIEATLRKVLEQILQQPLYLQAASRTDVGVHAEGQVVSFSTQFERPLCYLMYSANQLLPDDIRIRDLWQAHPDFHPSTLAIAKEYHYLIDTGQLQLPLRRHFAWHVPATLDLQAMKRAARLLTGTHDFKAFCNQHKQIKYRSYTRTIQGISLIQPEKNLLILSIQANRFLYKMARNLVGNLVYVGRGRISLEELTLILQSKDRKLAGITAPAHGLTLKRVLY